MTYKLWLPKPHEYREYDKGRLILRRLGPGRYVGLRLPEFISLRGRSANAVLQKYDSRTQGRIKREYPERVPKPDNEGLRMAFDWLRRPWA